MISYDISSLQHVTFISATLRFCIVAHQARGGEHTRQRPSILCCTSQSDSWRSWFSDSTTVQCTNMRDGSIPINTIFREMNIHLPAILMFTRGTRFWHTAMNESNMYKHVHTVVQTVGISRNLSESVGCRAQVAVAEECLWLLSQSIYNIRYTEAGVAVSRCAPFGSLWISVDLLWFFCGRLGHTLGLFHSTAESCHHSYVLGQVSTSTWKKHGKKHTDQRRFRIGRMGRDANWTFTPGRSEWKSIGCSLPVDWLVVWNIFYFPFHVWDNPSHWLIFFKMVIAPPTRLDLH